MKKVTQDPEVLLAQARWQFFGRLFNALRSGGQRIVEASLQGAAEQQVEAVRGPGGEAFLWYCPELADTFAKLPRQQDLLA